MTITGQLNVRGTNQIQYQSNVEILISINHVCVASNLHGYAYIRNCTKNSGRITDMYSSFIFGMLSPRIAKLENLRGEWGKKLKFLGGLNSSF